YSDKSVALLTKDQWMKELNPQQAANSVTAHKHSQAAVNVPKEIAAHEEDLNNNNDEDLNPEELGEEIAALVTRKFRKLKFTRKRPAAIGQAAKAPQNSTIDKSSVRCYNCNGIGHFAN